MSILDSFEKKKYKSPYNSTKVLDEVKAYTPPILREGKEWYIEFYAFCPEIGRLKRKRIKINRVCGITKRRSYCKDVIKRLTIQLEQGWNPWLSTATENYATLSDAIERYEKHILKMYDSGYFRKDTYISYKSYLSNFIDYVNSNPIYYLYQLDKKYCSNFLDQVFLERNNLAQTRNNYLGWLGQFVKFCINKGMMENSPVAGISPIDRRYIKKQREVIPSEKVCELARWLEANDPHFLLVCYLLYYCYIRPKEITTLLVSDIKIKECIVTIKAENSKNHRTQAVTLPKKVLHYAISLGIFNAAEKDYIFSKSLKPGKESTTTKILRDHWSRARKALGFPASWKFYSLKDTGITEMLENNIASLAVRDQARHSSLAITNIYAAQRQGANPEVFNWEGSL